MTGRLSSWDRSKVKKHTRRIFLAAAAAFFSGTTAKPRFPAAYIVPEAGKSIRWLVFYGASAEETILARYDIVVLDRAFQGSIDQIAAAGTRVCGYLSLGEIRASDPFVTYLDPAALMPENPDWPGTHRVDVRNPSWHSLVLDRQIPSLTSQGFTGLMFDTLDTPPYLEQLNPVRYQGMREAAVVLVDSIRARWPELMLIMNRGYALLPDVVEKVDAVIAESLMTLPNPQTGGFSWAKPSQVENQLTLLKPAAERHPPIPILSLDYANPDDAATIAELYRRERELGHHPYVATRSLDRIVEE